MEGQPKPSGRPAGPAQEVDLAAVLTRLEGWGSARGWVGPDPYEGLNSPLGRLARGTRPRQAVIQAYKLSPVAPPRFLRPPSLPNAKALALALSGYATPAGQELPGADEFVALIPRELERLNLAAEGSAWGYHFDAQTRHLFYDRSTPNAIATCFAVGALCDAAAATGDSRSTELALSARPYLLSLLSEAPDRGPFFSYVATGSQLIHNANMMVCGALARLHRIQPDGEAERVVRAAAATTLGAQRTDGLWPYGESGNLQWIDNFHTAYTLEGIVELVDSFELGATELQRGLDAWQDRFFDSDGWAFYYPDRRYPLEAHCSASAIDLLCRAASGVDREARIRRARLIAESSIRELWLAEAGRFGFRRTQRGLNRREFMRWTNAPMFRALARLCSAGEGELRRSRT